MSRVIFTRRSVLVGLAVLVAARLVSATVLTDPPPHGGTYIVGDRIAARSGIPTARSFITNSLALKDHLYPLSTERTKKSGSDVELTVLFASFVDAVGILGDIRLDSTNLRDVSVESCKFVGNPTSEEGYEGDILRYGTLTTTRVGAIVGAPGAGEAQVLGMPAAGSACDQVVTLTPSITNTTLGMQMAFGIDAESSGDASSQHLMVQAIGTPSNPSGFDGSLHFYRLQPMGGSVHATLLDVVEGSGFWDFYPADSIGVPDFPSAGDDSFLIGPFFRASSDPRVILITVPSGTDTPVVLGSFNDPTATLLGQSLAVVGDTTGDMVPEFAAASDGSVYLIPGDELSGAGGGTITNFLWKVDSPIPNIDFGRALEGGFDYDADMIPDVAVGAPGADPFGLVDAGTTYILSGKTGGILTEFHGRQAGDSLAYSKEGIFWVGDIGQPDGVPDFLIHAGNHPAWTTITETRVIHDGDWDARLSTPPFPRQSFISHLGPFGDLRERVKDWLAQ